MGYLKYGKDRHKPPGVWVQTTHLTDAVGLSHRKPDVILFAQAVKKAEKQCLPYGLVIERQPNNAHDPNAIALYGVATTKGWFGVKQHEWHIGFVPADVAADVSPNLIDAGVPVAVELYGITEGSDDFYEVKFLILGPSGYGVKKRLRE